MLRSSAIALMAAALLVTAAAPAAAENLGRVGPTTFAMFNPCAPEDGLITFTGYMHTAKRVRPDGVTVFHTNSHFTGVSVIGTPYVLNITSVITSEPATTYLHRGTISRGPGDDSWLLIRTSPPPVEVIEHSCRG